MVSFMCAMTGRLSTLCAVCMNNLHRVVMTDPQTEEHGNPKFSNFVEIFANQNNNSGDGKGVFGEVLCLHVK